ncbi:MAG: hypothetical protein M0Q38_12835, partial [Bacteroidales bacterium]|nr:hypothetical protein [Bacteroidales bacterium]
MTFIKNKVVLVLAVLLSTANTEAQIGINTDGTQPGSAAMLDIKSTEKGFLPPRMTKVQRNAIVNPPAGLMVFCTDCTEGNTGILSMFANGVWSNFTPCLVCSSPSSGTHISTPTQITWNWSSVPLAIGYKWNTVNDYNTATDIGPNTSTIESGLTCNTSYASYVWGYNDCGISASTSLTQSTSLNPPAAPIAGTHVPSPTQIVWHWTLVTLASGYKFNSVNDYNTATDIGPNNFTTETGLNCNTPYIRYVWAYNNCGVSSSTSMNQTTSMNPPAAPVVGTHVPSYNQIIWHWNSVPAAAGYKWNITDNYTTATDMLTNLSKTETALTCNAPYTRYVWAYNNCGVSISTTLAQTTSLNPPANPIAGTHIATYNQIEWHWNVVPQATGYKWNNANDSTTATKIGSGTTKTETGLNCNTSYTRYLWAYGNCGTSPVTTLTKSTTLNPPTSPIAGTH